MRTTKRKYAHELYPHPGLGEVRPLAVEVPYLYARAIGFDYYDVNFDNEGSRARMLLASRTLALLADAALQGLSGDAAWRFVVEHVDESGELVWDRAVANGVDPNKIKPYRCGPEPANHMCGHGLPEGCRRGASGREDECPHCSEETP